MLSLTHLLTMPFMFMTASAITSVFHRSKKGLYVINIKVHEDIQKAKVLYNVIAVEYQCKEFSNLELT